MRLSQTAEYALRAMAHLAAVPPGAAARAEDLSEVTGIPVAYVSKILRRMVVAGLLVSRRGHGGGFTLARPAAAIRFKDVLEAVDYDTGVGRCAFGWGTCDPERPCPLHGAWTELARGFCAWSEAHTLADLPPSTAPRPLAPARQTDDEASDEACPVSPPRRRGRRARGKQT